MISRKAGLTTLAALAVASSLSCAAKTNGGATGGGFVPIDKNRPGDALFADALAHFNLGVSAQSAGFTERKLGNGATATTDFQTAQTEFTTAQGLFDQLKNDAALCGPTPTSIRCDAAGYYGGRCSYELGLASDELAALTGAASTAVTSFQDAVTRLDAMKAAYPGSWMIDQASYFDGRARFHLAQAKVVGFTWADARAQFQASLAANAAGTYADNSQYYVGRCWFEDGLALVNVPVRPLPGSPDYVAATADFQNAEVELKKVLSSYPGSTYVVNARYYLGKTFYERPFDPAALAGRIADLGTAIGWFDQVIAANGLFVGGAHYWRGRCHYALAFDLVTPPAPPDVTELGNALLDLKAVPATDVYADNALYFDVKSYMNLHVATATDATGSYCTAVRTPDAPPASACAANTALKTLYPASPYVAKAASYISTFPTVTACVCP